MSKIKEFLQEKKEALEFKKLMKLGKKDSKTTTENTETKPKTEE